MQFLQQWLLICVKYNVIIVVVVQWVKRLDRSVLTANQTSDRVSCHIVNNTHCQIRLFNVACQALVKCQLLLSTPTSVMHVWESVSVSRVMMQISHGNVNWLSRHCQLSTTPSVLLSTKCQSCPIGQSECQQEIEASNASLAFRVPSLWWPHSCPLWANHSQLAMYCSHYR